MKTVTIVIPTYHSEGTIPLLVQRLNEFQASPNAPSFQVFFIDDASTDRTIERLQEANKHFDCRIFKMLQNQGQHTVTAYGIGLADTPYIATIDDDLQHDPFELIRLIEEQKKSQADLVYGIYEHKEHSIIRNLGSFLLKRMFKLMGIDYNDVTSFRLFKAEIGQAFQLLQNKVIFLDFELQQLARKKSACRVKHAERKEGRSSYSMFGLIKFATRILLFHSGFPLRLISRLGLIIAVICFVLGIYFIYAKIIHNAPIGFTSIIVSIFFSTGLVLFSLGIIGEYIRKLWIHSSSLKSIQIQELHETE
ncbi:MAG: glycosyltransferase family 2 protein [Flavobacteriales bacterium]